MNKTRLGIYCSLILICFFFLNCAALDNFAGVDPVTGQRDPAGGLAGSAGSLLSGFGPWGALAGAAVGAFGSIYGTLRSRRYHKCAFTLAKAIGTMRESRDGNGKLKLTNDNLTEILEAVKREDGTGKDVERLIKKLEGQKNG